MTMGDYIRILRKKHGLTQDELGQSLNPPINKSAIAKWEKGQVENIKRSHIIQMSSLFSVNPSDLMCFDNEWNSIVPQNNGLSDEEIVFQIIKDKLGSDYLGLLTYYQKLNTNGKNKLMEICRDLTSLPRYRK